MIKQPIINLSYESPSTRVILVSPMRCIADSVRGVSMSNMDVHNLCDDESFDD